MNTASSAHFDRQYQSHLKHLKLKGLQPKTVEAYSRAIRRIGNGFLVHGKDGGGFRPAQCARMP